MLSQKFDFMPWLIYYLDEVEKKSVLQQNQELQDRLTSEQNIILGTEVYIAKGATLLAEKGKISINDRSYVADGVRIYNQVSIGKNCSVNTNCMLDGGEWGITIGDDTRIASDVGMFAFNHNYEDPKTLFRLQGLRGKGIQIGSDVGIAHKAIILDGVKIGDHSFVAAGSVVTKDIPPYAIVAGNPAKILQYKKS